MAFLVPMIMHGAYDFVASMKGRLWIMLFFFLVAGYEVIGIVKVNEASKADVQLK
ncbi:MAG: hypothetical protein K6E91_09505 [Butyrivibrio sp.]|nr:hypothetical protein [Butyrivibrio sp.]